MELPTSQDLKERRESLELTQSELAERAGVSQPLIARIEGGDVDPRLSTLRGIVEALERAEGDVVRAEDLMNSDPVSVEPDDSVENALDVMDSQSFSQLPVVRDGKPEGIISNTDIRQAKGEREGPVGRLPVDEVMHESIATKEPSAPLEEIDSALDHHRAVLVVSGGEVVGIITEADVAAAVS